MNFLLRQPSSGVVVTADNDGDSIFWDAAAQEWRTGPPSGGGAVASVFGRVGAVVAQSGDYDSDEINNVSGVAGASVSDALDNVDADAAAAQMDATAAQGDATQALADAAAAQIDATAALARAQFILMFGSDAGASPAVAFFGSWRASGTIAEDDFAKTKSPLTGTLRNLRVGGVAGATITVNAATFVVRVNGADTAVTCGIAIAGNSGSDLTNTVAVNANDDVSISIVNQPTMGGVFWASLELH